VEAPVQHQRDAAPEAEHAGRNQGPRIGRERDPRHARQQQRAGKKVLPGAALDAMGKSHDQERGRKLPDVFVDKLALAEFGLGGVYPGATGRPSYHPSVLLKLYIYGYLNRVKTAAQRAPHFHPANPLFWP
jgi:hypothetical protein